MGWEEHNTEIKQILIKEQQALLDKYDALDYLGKHTVIAVLEAEFNKCK